jgi:hypothetical protein
MSLKRGFVALVLVGLAGAATLALAADSMVGTWKLNAAKSKAPYKSGTSVAEAAGDGIKVTVDLVGTDGTAWHWSWSAKYDGKDNPVAGKTPFGDSSTVALTRVDANTIKLVGKSGGKVMVNQTIATSADGKTRTVTSKGTNAKGEPVDTVTVYDKQ